MKLSDITNIDLLGLIENATQLFRLNKYRDKDTVEAYIGLAVQQSYFYGVIDTQGNTRPLKLSDTKLNSHEDITLEIDGIVRLAEYPVNLGVGDIVLTGYGIIEVNDVLVYDGRRLNTYSVTTSSTNGGNSGNTTSLDYSKVSEVNEGGVRIGDTVGPTIPEALDQILSAAFEDLAYSYSINYSLVEKGLSVTPTSTWNIIPNDDTVTDVSILRNNIEENNQGTTLSGSYSHLNSIDFSNSISERAYEIKVTSTDAGLNSVSRSVSFVAPTYSGVLGISDIDETNIKTLTKYVRSRATQNNISFSPTLQRYIYAYPKSFGLLSSIKDPSNFEAINTFNVSEITFTLADGTSEIMYIYVSNADTTQTNFLQDFIF